MKKIDDYPEIKSVLDKCYEEIQTVTGKKCYVKFIIKFRDIDTDNLKRIICRACEVTWEQVTGSYSGGGVIIARHLYCYYARLIQEKSFPRIASEINRVYMTVMASCKRVQDMIDSNDELYMHYISKIEILINKHYDNEVKAEQQRVSGFVPTAGDRG